MQVQEVLNYVMQRIKLALKRVWDWIFAEEEY